MRRNVRRLNREVLEVTEGKPVVARQPVNIAEPAKSESSSTKEKSCKTSKDTKKTCSRKAANLAELQR